MVCKEAQQAWRSIDVVDLRCQKAAHCAGSRPAPPRAIVAQRARRA
jgi:hypothetical protein